VVVILSAPEYATGAELGGSEIIEECVGEEDTRYDRGGLGVRCGSQRPEAYALINVAQSQSDWFVTDGPSPVVDGISSSTFISNGDGSVPVKSIDLALAAGACNVDVPRLRSASSSLTVCM
jgi:hypothetical protein